MNYSQPDWKDLMYKPTLKERLRKIFTWVAVVIGMILVCGLLFMALGGIERIQAAQPIHTVTFETFGDHINENVILVGRLELLYRINPSDVFTGERCEFILLEDPDDSANTINICISHAYSGESAVLNQMEYIPYSYTDEDLKLKTNDGRIAGAGDLVAITGRSCSDLSFNDSFYEGWCIYRITKIELIEE